MRVKEYILLLWVKCFLHAYQLRLVDSIVQIYYILIDFLHLFYQLLRGMQCGRLAGNLPARFDPWFGKIPGERKGYPLQYPCLENSKDRGYSSWDGTVRHDWATDTFTFMLNSTIIVNLSISPTSISFYFVALFRCRNI